MREVTRGTTTAAHARHRCVRCGFAGGDLQPRRDGQGGLVGSAVLTCPNCGQDLYTRPPRSYAELEGFVEPVPPRRRVSAGVPIPDDGAVSQPGKRTLRSAEAGLFLVLLATVGMLVLLRLFDAIG